ncbi:MAG: hypothetical protein LBF41_00485 [Deltaproteobacteria bacterium]|nr:hypothetical protein [Deltaproteobacteria bacterium]
MKIDSYNPEAVFLRPRNESVTGAPNPKIDGGEDFSALLEEKAKFALTANSLDPSAATGSDKTSGTAFLTQSSLASIQLSKLRLQSQTQATSEEVTAQIQDALALLESYAAALGDPENTLKDMAPMAEELSLSADALNTLGKSLKAGDPLKDLTGETATLSAVEALKFKRGDFV